MVCPRLFSGFENHYKIKLKASGYRLVYEVVDNELFVLVIAVGKRDKNTVCKGRRKKKIIWAGYTSRATAQRELAGGGRSTSYDLNWEKCEARFDLDS